MKRFIAVLAIVALAATSGCSNNASSDTLTDSTEVVLQAVLDAASEKLGDNAPKLEVLPVDDAGAPGALGLSETDFTALVAQANVANALMMTDAQEIAVVKVQDIAQAGDVAKKIADGFDSLKWICVRPDKSVVITSGSYILLAVGTVENVDAYVQAFSDLAQGKVGEANTFFTGP